MAQITNQGYQRGVLSRARLELFLSIMSKMIAFFVLMPFIIVVFFGKEGDASSFEF